MASINTIPSGAVFAWFMLLIFVRRVVMLVIGGIAGRHRPFLPGARPPEDRILKKAQPETTQIEFTKDIRVNKTISNDSENDPYFLILLLATAVFSDGISGSSTKTIVYGAIYLFARTFYAVAYIMGLQPWRTLAYCVGMLCTLVCSLDLVITMSMRSN